MHNSHFSSTCYLLFLLALLRPVAVCLLLPGCFHVVRAPMMTHSSHKPTHYRSTAMYNMYIQPNKIGRASKWFIPWYLPKTPFPIHERSVIDDQVSRYQSKNSTILFRSRPWLLSRLLRSWWRTRPNATNVKAFPRTQWCSRRKKNSNMKRCKANAAINRHYSMSIADAVRDHTSASVPRKPRRWMLVAVKPLWGFEHTSIRRYLYAKTYMYVVIQGAQCATDCPSQITLCD